MDYLLGVDVGSLSTKVVLSDIEGNIRGYFYPKSMASIILSLAGLNITRSVIGGVILLP